ncbi:unnamed protein product [Rangifer tarandus platyrhynchus]|uniref:Uncharacterized protein n=1 Tax=Rangifer tarandus platyrhynchus TaxID=3082113 RepID=A0ABN8Y5D1_RANTA|nr:unnamed protein product [Rangifer tarandus platyrhynchus]
MKIMVLRAQLLLPGSENVDVIEGACAGAGRHLRKADLGEEEETVDLGMMASLWSSVLGPSNPGSFCTSFCPDFQQVFCGELKSLAQVVDFLALNKFIKNDRPSTIIILVTKSSKDCSM